MSIGELLDRRAISPRASAPNKRQALSVIADIAARTFGVDAEDALDFTATDLMRDRGDDPYEVEEG